MLPEYIVQVSVGGLGAIAYYKALTYGKASILSPISKANVLIILATSIIFLGEELTTFQIAGALLIVISAIIIALDGWKFRLEKWMLYLGIASFERMIFLLRLI
jgi:drug/metabolite transporter (DMT)-like permease